MIMGDPAIGTNAIYRQLLGNLIAHGGGPLLIRIGGSTADRTTEPTSNTVTPFAQLYRDLEGCNSGVSFILGVNMGANNARLATRQAKAFVEGMPEDSIEAIEMGNQPDFFVFNKYRTEGYSFDNYLVDFRAFAQSIRAIVPNCPPFMAPSMGGFAGIPPLPLAPKTDFGTPEEFKKLLEQEDSTLGIVSQHAYTGGSKLSGDHPCPGFLLLPTSSTQDPKDAEPYIAVADAWNKPYRMAEMNSIMASGEPGVSDAFEAALWTVDILFEYIARGVDGVNLHTNIWNTIYGWEIYDAFLFDVPESQYRGLQIQRRSPRLSSGSLMATSCGRCCRCIMACCFLQRPASTTGSC